MRTGPDPQRRGAVTPLVAILLLVLVALVAFAVDLGAITLTRTQLQAAADAAAVAAAAQIDTTRPASQQAAATEAAIRCAGLNTAGGKAVTLTGTDITYGHRDDKTKAFTANGSPVNAVQVAARRDDSNANGPLRLFFAPVLGISTANVQAEAIGLAASEAYGTRFLIDDEMLDTDVPAIEAVAKKAGKSAEQLLKDKDGDWWIDLHQYTTPGQKLELPTGQIGDEALFDVEANKGKPLGQFPYTPTSSPSLKDFLNYDENSSSWRYNLIHKSKLDPLPGVGRWNDHSRYASLVDPNFIHVSPVWKSDVSALDGVGEPAKKGVNALGQRRGLFAFKIVGIGKDVDGPNGKELPHLIIEVVDPSGIDLDKVVLGSSKGNSRVRLVR